MILRTTNVGISVKDFSRDVCIGLVMFVGPEGYRRQASQWLRVEGVKPGGGRERKEVYFVVGWTIAVTVS